MSIGYDEFVKKYVKNGIVYEIITPQANPYLNYVFFEKDRADVPDDAAVKNIAEYFMQYKCEKQGHKIWIRGKINKGRDCDCSTFECERDRELAVSRSMAVRDILIKYGVSDQCIKIDIENVRCKLDSI